MGFRVLFAFFCFAFSSLSFAVDSEIVWDADKRQPVRENILKCHTYLVPQEEKTNDSVGVLVSTNEVADFKKQLKTLVAQKGRDALKGGHIFVTGIAMDEEDETQNLFQQALQNEGLFPEDVKVHVLSAPSSLLGKDSETATKVFLQRLMYFFPSLERDYQKPTKEESISGIASTLLIEPANVAYLYQTMPLLDANLTVTSHTTLLVLYSVYKKFLINWLLRPGAGRVESFLKQMLVSFPFVLNYNVFGKFSTILNYYKDHGWAATAAQFPYEMANFATTQGVSVFLQTLFYNLVITDGVRGWENRQIGTERSAAARSISNWITVPILAFDAVILAMAGANSNVLAHLGPLDINSGHAGLVALTAVGSALWIWPHALDPILDVYLKTKQFFFSKKESVELKGERK